MQRKPVDKKLRTTTGKTSGNTFTMPAASDARPPQPNSGEMYDRIRQRAYELYEERGRQDGLDQQDWLRAEAELLSLLSRSA